MQQLDILRSPPTNKIHGWIKQKFITNFTNYLKIFQHTKQWLQLHKKLTNASNNSELRKTHCKEYYIASTAFTSATSKAHKKFKPQLKSKIHGSFCFLHRKITIDSAQIKRCTPRNSFLSLTICGWSPHRGQKRKNTSKI